MAEAAELLQQIADSLEGLPSRLADLMMREPVEQTRGGGINPPPPDLRRGGGPQVPQLGAALAYGGLGVDQQLGLIRKSEEAPEQQQQQQQQQPQQQPQQQAPAPRPVAQPVYPNVPSPTVTPVPPPVTQPFPPPTATPVYPTVPSPTVTPVPPPITEPYDPHPPPPPQPPPSGTTPGAGVGNTPGAGVGSTPGSGIPTAPAQPATAGIIEDMGEELVEVLKENVKATRALVEKFESMSLAEKQQLFAEHRASGVKGVAGFGLHPAPPPLATGGGAPSIPGGE
jgi:hypothetical protein